MSWRHVSSTFIPGWMRARTSYRPDLIPSSLSKEGPTSALKSDARTKTGGGGIKAMQKWNLSMSSKACSFATYFNGIKRQPFGEDAGAVRGGATAPDLKRRSH